MAKIETQGLSKTYRSGGETTVALNDLTLSVREGEFLTIVGPSGCGKSTLLYIIAGFLKPSAGRVLVDGRPVEAPGTDRGIVFQEYALFPWRTVLDNILFGLEYQALSRPERLARARQYIEFMGLEGFEHRYPKELSGGMKQRVALARTLCYNPDVLLLDEPFGALDAQTREIMQDELLRVWRETKKTVLMVTHSVSEAVYLSDRVIVMTSRPGTRKAEFAVGLDRAGSREQIILTPAFAELQSRIWMQVREEVLRSRT
ncbi:MAG: ABC transporter ATP-binding protein [Deltaproteobacteria bacterium]|nr:ABC transporter ATP-binding protein [Deltaproteobacteria bacterium]